MKNFKMFLIVFVLICTLLSGFFAINYFLQGLRIANSCMYPGSYKDLAECPEFNHFKLNDVDVYLKINGLSRGDFLKSDELRKRFTRWEKH